MSKSKKTRPNNKGKLRLYEFSIEGIKEKFLAFGQDEAEMFSMRTFNAYVTSYDKIYISRNEIETISFNPFIFKKK